MYKLKKDKLNKIMYKNKLSRKDVAQGSKISLETLNNWMYRQTSSRYDLALRLADFLDLDISEMFDEI